MITPEQFAYGAIFGFSAKWGAARRAVYARRPRRRSSGMLAWALAALSSRAY